MHIKCDQRIGRHSTNKRDLSSMVSNKIISRLKSLIKIFFPTKFISTCIPFSRKAKFMFVSGCLMTITFVAKVCWSRFKKDSSFKRDNKLDAFKIFRIFASSLKFRESYSFGFGSVWEFNDSASLILS